MSDVLPFKAEYAKSGRAGCKGCKETIGKDSLRLAIMVQSHMFDGKVPNWFHYDCFWRRAKVGSPTDIHGYESLRWDDQQKIKSKLSGGGGAAGGGGGGDVDNISTNFATEYAKSGASQCRGCADKIAKNQVRVSVKDYASERAVMFGPMDLWHHLDCFVEKRDEVDFPKGMDPTKIKGYKQLKQEDRELILEKLGKGDSKKRKASETKSVAAKKSKKETAEEKALRDQSELLWKIKDNLKREVSNEAMKLLLEYNKQATVSGESKLLERVSDCMVFGALEKCAECKNGQLVYSSNAYHCTGDLTEWTKCIYTTQKPKRKPFKVPKEYHDVDFLKKYKYEKRDRVFSSDAVVAVKDVVSSAAASSSSQGKPLHGLKFYLIGETQKPRGELSLQIERLGGQVVAKPDKKLAACISNKEEVEKLDKDMKSVKRNKVDVVSEVFVSEVSGKEQKEVFDLIKQHGICDWASDVKGRIGDVVDGPMKSVAPKSNLRAKEESMFTKSVPKKMKMTVKGGAAVDPDSGLDHKAHVLQEGGDLYTAVLGLVDIVNGTNSYYKLQLLEGDKKMTYWIFRSWGRVGTTIGGTKTEKFMSKANGISQFESLYLDKTGNHWENRKNFEKVPKKFYPLELDYGQEDTNVQTMALTGENSELPKPVQDLIKMIFDVESMKKAMLEMEIDLQKMPLGKLSKKQIESAYKVLTELTGLIDKGGSQSLFLDASNRFYTLIPHDFGLNKPPMLDTKEVIQAKTLMLDNLLEIEVAYSLLQQGGDGGKDPIDVHYEQLKSSIEPLEKGPEYEMMEEYVKNTHASTHTAYTLEIDQIFKVRREGEAKKYKPFKQLNNRMLLWHGSRTTNYAGILSQGLRIAPPEAPVTGYMFGKGIYFADMVSKSANYCSTRKSDPYGLLMLCEVALGNMYERFGADYIEKLPKGMHSTKGVGRTHPDPTGVKTTADGVIVPTGLGMPSGVENTSLLYNEYIVYDVAQVNIQYLFKLKFNFKF